MQKNRINIKTGRTYVFIETSSIILIRAENIYSSVYLTDDKRILASHPIGELEKKLEGYDFFRPHRSYLINTSFVLTYSKADAAIYMQGYDNPVPVSRKVKHLFEALLLR